MRIPYDAEKRTIAIPSKSVHLDNLDTFLQNRMFYMVIGLYGSSKYGRAVYGANYGQYGSDVYGDSVYY